MTEQFLQINLFQSAYQNINSEIIKEERKHPNCDTMMRLSAGIENVEDLIADMVQALE